MDVAKRSWDDRSPFGEEVMVMITYFFDGASLDVDNIPKPILDAMKGLVFSDDSQVSDLLCRKRDLNSDLQIQSPSSILIAALRGSQQFVHVAVTRALAQEVASW